MIKLVLIDIDDTICNSSEAYKRAEEKCFKYVHKKFPLIDKKLFDKTYQEARRQIHLELEGTASQHNRFLYFQRMFELLGISLNPDVLDEVTNLYWEEVYRNIRLYPTVKKTLKILKENNIKVGVVSDLIANIQIRKLEKLGIAEFIDFIVTSEEAGKEKPHPAQFLLALKKSHCLPEEAVMVGDSIEKDIEGAKLVGIKPVLIRNRKHAGITTITRFDQLLSIVNCKERRLSNRKLVVFDLMGTLFKEAHIVRDVLLPLLTKSSKAMPYKKLYKMYILYSMNKITKDEFNKIVPEQVENEMLHALKLNKDVKQTLKHLKAKGYLIGVLSNIPKEWGIAILKIYGLDKLMDVIVFSGEYGTRKPSEELYRVLLEKINVKPNNIYLVDDKLENLREARFLLMKTIWKKNREIESFIPDYAIRNIKEIKNILK